MKNYLYDYHVHSRFSSDGNDSICKICRYAIDKEIKEIAITDHFEPTTGNEEYTSYNPEEYWNEIEKARDIFEGRLKIKAGIEMGQPHRFPKSSERVIKQIPYDFILGSMHKFPEDIDCSEIDYAGIKLEDICSLYLKQLEMMIKGSDFDCIGHIDLIKRYSKNVYHKKVTLTIQHEFFAEVLKMLIQKGKGLEINTSGLRQNIGETMPGLETLILYRQLGGEILTVGSDAHFACDVGEGIQYAVELASRAGFRYLAVYNKRKPEFIKIDENNDFYNFIPNKKTAACI